MNRRGFLRALPGIVLGATVAKMLPEPMPVAVEHDGSPIRRDEIATGHLTITSRNYVPYSAGWVINADGFSAYHQ